MRHTRRYAFYLAVNLFARFIEFAYFAVKEFQIPGNHATGTNTSLPFDFSACKFDGNEL